MKKFTIAASIVALVGGLLTATTANSATLRVPKTLGRFALLLIRIFVLNLYPFHLMQGRRSH